MGRAHLRADNHHRLHASRVKRGAEEQARRAEGHRSSPARGAPTCAGPRGRAAGPTPALPCAAAAAPSSPSRTATKGTSGGAGGSSRERQSDGGTGGGGGGGARAAGSGSTKPPPGTEQEAGKGINQFDQSINRQDGQSINHHTSNEGHRASGESRGRSGVWVTRLDVLHSFSARRSTERKQHDAPPLLAHPNPPTCSTDDGSSCSQASTNRSSRAASLQRRGGGRLPTQLRSSERVRRGGGEAWQEHRRAAAAGVK